MSKKTHAKELKRRAEKKRAARAKALEENPPTLGIHVSEKIKARDKFGG